MIQLISSAISLFFVLDPFGNLPGVMGLLSRVTPRRRPVIVFREGCMALLLLVIFYLAGGKLMHWFGVDGPDLNIAGGMVLVVTALRMVFPERTPVPDTILHAEPLIVPIAIPMMAGPSALAMVMLMAAQSAGDRWLGLSMVAAAAGSSVAILTLGIIVGGYIPERLLHALHRLAGILLIVLAVHMFMSGIKAYLRPGAEEIRSAMSMIDRPAAPENPGVVRQAGSN
jgi:multiple antibiotic resistance protein